MIRFLHMCLTMDCLSSAAGALPGKILIVCFHTASYKPKHVYFYNPNELFSPSCPPHLSLSPSLSLARSLFVIKQMGLSTKCFWKKSNCGGMSLFFLEKARIGFPLFYVSIIFLPLNVSSHTRTCAVLP